MKRSQFVDGVKFKIHERIYMFVADKPTTVNPEVGALMEKGYGGMMYHCNIEKLTGTGIRVYKTVCGQIVRVTCKFSEMTLVTE